MVVYRAANRLYCTVYHLPKKKANAVRLFVLMPEWTGLEPATPGVTGRYSNQLNYRSAFNHLGADTEPAPRPGLPPLVGADGLEPPTFAL